MRFQRRGPPRGSGVSSGVYSSARQESSPVSGRPAAKARTVGCADYAIGRPATWLIVEAKREGVYFELPIGVGPGVMNLSTLFASSAEFERAARQVLTYCHERGVPLAAVTNGHQIVAFLASRQDGVPPLEGRALVFD